ncbi:MAG: sulfotransferase [Mesorhizobium sp.]
MTRQASLTAQRHGPIITPDMLPGSDGANINGPSLIRIPDWVPDRLAAYYLYFADHRGTYIRLAYSDSLHGPWRVHPGGVLSLDQCPFIEEHIASPDVHVDDRNRRFVMYFHGPTKTGKGQTTFAATSVDGLHFAPSSEPLGPSYARIFQHDGWWYGLLGTGAITLFRSRDGISDFERGPVVLPRPFRGHRAPRHVAVQKSGRWLRVYYTRRGDAPERILHGTIDLARDWQRWKVRGKTELLRPQTDFEGVDRPIRRSRMGPAKGRENALRDPAIFEENGRTWLLYAVAGESGIALAEILSASVRTMGIRRPIAALEIHAGRLVRRFRRIVSPTKSSTKIFIAGCARSGTTLTQSLMACFDDVYVRRGEAKYQTLLELDRRETNLVVKRIAESHEDLAVLPASVGLIYCVRHPFDVLTSSHPVSAHLRRFHVTIERWEAEYDGLMRLRKAQPERTIFYLRYEDLIAGPDAAQENIARLFGLSPAIRFSEDPNNPIRPTSLRKWESNEEFRTYLEGLSPAFLARVERFCGEFGYDMPADKGR